jgi:hypothetical protein
LPATSGDFVPAHADVVVVPPFSPSFDLHRCSVQSLLNRLFNAGMRARPAACGSRFKPNFIAL